MNKAAVEVIEDYIQRNFSRPINTWNKYLFMQRSYSKWVAEEILERVKNETKLPPSIVIENFIHKLDKWACENQENSMIFSTAYDTAVDIMDMFL